MNRFFLAMSALLLAGGGLVGQAQAGEDDVWQREQLTGDWGGSRSSLSDHGVDIGLNYVGEALGNLSGGIKTGWSYEGRAEFALDLDLDKLVGWQGGAAHANVFQIHHTNGSPAVTYTGSIGDPSNIEARQATRLYTLWLQQTLFDDVLSVRAGQLAVDDEFMTSDTAGNLINGTFGWAALGSANMTSGGPAYPLPTPGVRVEVAPTKSLALRGAVFSGDPAGKNCFDDPQVCNKRGTTFSTSGGALWMGELQYSINQEDGATGLPGVYKIGGWYQTGNFADQRLGLDALGALVSLADPTVVDAYNHHGDRGIYAIADQTVWKGEARSLALFARVGGAPSDRNLVSFYADAGLAYVGLIPGRQDDTLALGVAYSKISGDAADLDRDTQVLTPDPAYPVRDHETVIEVSYTAQVAPWWSLQPDFQYIVHPGGHVLDADDPANAVAGNAVVVGLRTGITF
jgi:porin